MLKEEVIIAEQDAALSGYLSLPKNPIGIVIFSNSSGESRNAPESDLLAQRLFEGGIGTLLLDLLTDSEGHEKGKIYNIKLLSLRLEAAMDWVSKHKLLRGLPAGLFGADTGSAAAMSAAAQSKHEISALVSRGGRIDMADKFLPYVEAPCLLLVGEKDELGLKANKSMLELLNYARFHVIEGAGHDFSKTEELEEVAAVATRWFKRYFNRKSYQEHSDEYRPEKLKIPFYDRYEAGHFLARSLMKYKNENPLILAIPRGAVAMADIIATELDCQMDIVLVKKISAPNNQELTIGSINEFGDVYLSGNAKAYANEEMINELAQRAQRNLKEYRDKLGSAHEPISFDGRTVIIVDDGIATGSTMLSAVITVKEKGAKKVVVAAPVVSSSAQKMLELASDETVFLNIPENFYAVAQFYQNYPQVGDAEVEQIFK